MPTSAMQEAVNLENGCRYHPDCFTCPFFDCLFSMTIKEQYAALREVRGRYGTTKQGERCS